MNTHSVNLIDKFAAFAEHWSPKLIAECNGQHVRIAKVQGEFIWHTHEDADELFFVVRGSLTIHLRDGEVHLNQGELFVVPRGVEHMPAAQDECWIMLFEPANTLNTGNIHNERTQVEVPRV